MTTHKHGDRGVAEYQPDCFVAIKRTEDDEKSHIFDCSKIEDKKKKLMRERVDPRLFNLSLDSNDARFLDYRTAVESLLDVKLLSTAVRGPSTVPWLLKFWLNNGGIPTAAHSRFMTDCRLDYSASDTSTHQLIAKFFEVLITIDQVDPSTLSAAELLSRKVQMIHERWRHKLPNLGQTSGGQNSAEDDSYLLLGTSETRANIGVCPELNVWLGEELSKEAATNKERRKAREERAALGKKT